jgi:transcriptional regulator with PAS, ATPase and Fis domain
MENKDYLSGIIGEIKDRFGIIGSSQQIYEAIEKMLQAAPTDLTVLITGETGTGKEVFANAIHGLSKRKNNAFVSVNCGAIPETLLESELFGHEKGAFTGAVDSRVGFFESAHKGTIFLDEIGDMPIGTQVKLLRVLESGAYSKLGSSAINKVDARVIAATNRELEKRVREGKFRQDLFFRLNSVHIILPPLRNHPQDIVELVDFFGKRICKKLVMKYEGISTDALNVLKSLPWPGNIRELKNLVETVITLEKGAFITPEVLRRFIPAALPAYESRQIPLENSIVTTRHLEQSNNEVTLIFRTLLELKNEVTDIKHALHDLILDVNMVKDNTENLQVNNYEEIKAPEDIFGNLDNLNLAEIEKRMLTIALNRHEGNRRLAAESLGISERTLYRKISDYGIEV